MVVSQDRIIVEAVGAHLGLPQSQHKAPDKCQQMCRNGSDFTDMAFSIREQLCKDHMLPAATKSELESICNCCKTAHDGFVLYTRSVGAQKPTEVRRHEWYS